jgi:hypothetical protein
MPLINVADLVDPHDPERRTWRQINAAMLHNLPLDALVELDTGVRLFVVLQGRDCDQTPLYWLAAKKAAASDAIDKLTWIGGYPEDSLTVIKLPGE